MKGLISNILVILFMMFMGLCVLIHYEAFPDTFYYVEGTYSLKVIVNWVSHHSLFLLLVTWLGILLSFYFNKVKIGGYL